jgi:hypothetical protein
VATALAVAGSRLFVAIAPNSRVRIYDISNPGAPTLSGEIDTAAPVEALKQIGTQLHVAETNWAKLLLCLLGRFCPKGQTVEVFDVVDPSAAVLLGSYDGDMSPVVHQRTYRDYGYVRDRDGLRRFHFVPLQ